MKIKKTALVLLAAGVLLLNAAPANALRIRDVVRMKNEVPNELEGIGLVVGLRGTGDGGTFMPAIRPLKEMMGHFENPVQIEAELKNADNVALVHISMRIPPAGAHSGDRYTLNISSIGAAKSLKGGRLFIAPLLAPNPHKKEVYGWGSGNLVIEDDLFPTVATIRDGGVMIQDRLPEEITDGQFTLVLKSNAATREMSSAIADEINEEVSPETGGKSVALAVDATSVAVLIPKAELANPTPFIARLLARPLPKFPEPAKVFINAKSKTIVFTEEVELAPTMISYNGLSITIAPPGQTPPPGTDPQAFAPLPGVQGNVKLSQLESAFNLLKVTADDRIAIVKLLYDTNILKAELVLQ